MIYPEGESGVNFTSPGGHQTQFHGGGTHATNSVGGGVLGFGPGRPFGALAKSFFAKSFFAKSFLAKSF